MSEIIKFNDREFSFECGVISQRSQQSLDGTTKTNTTLAPISYNTLQELVINDSLFDPFLDATLTIKTNGNGVEATPLLGFEFYSNNNNGVIFKIQPIDVLKLNDQFKSDNTLEFYGVVCYQTVYGSDNSIEQLQEFKLQDIKEAKLRETKVAAVNIPNVMSSKSIQANIVDITSNIIGIGENNFFPAEQLKSNTLLNETSIRFDYTYPNHFNGFDAINFLLPYNITTINGLPIQNILKYNYTTAQFFNIPVVYPFLNPFQDYSNLETFVIGEDDSVPVPGFNQGATSQGPSPNIVLPSNKVNNIAYNNINFDIANNDLLPICVMNTTNPLNITSMVYVDLQEEIKLFDNNIIKQELTQLYGNDVKLNIDIDESKLNKLNYKIINTNLPINIAVDVAKAQLYNSFIFQNMYMTFTVPGQPYREPGKFINIKKTLTENTGSATQRKIIGQWLVTEVKHVFSGDGRYTNVIQCVKPFINK